jgi:hypothetical protein
VEEPAELVAERQESGVVGVGGCLRHIS